ncbi:MAG TPA: flavodoxin domain-containing protein [Mycobacteriales bacterium]|nr:flavodoxin domain-containing protein [Mycobacteriales bacterium]
MRVVVAFESMYGHTRSLAQAIAEGFEADSVTVLPISQLDRQTLAAADVLIVGSPTHAHGLPRVGTRKVAIASAHVPGDDQEVDPSAASTGVREWLATLPAKVQVTAATYDTRFRPPAWITGHPARHVARRLRRSGAELLAHPTSFYVDHHEQLRAGELERARSWGKRLAERARERVLVG